MKKYEAPSKVDMKKFKQRKTTVFKNAQELSILCGVDLALIMYHHDNPNPDVWCSKPGSINTIINKYFTHNKVQGFVQPIDEVMCMSANSRCQVGDCEFVKSLCVEELNNLAGVLAAKIDQANERINLLRSVSGNYPATDDAIHQVLEGSQYDDHERSKLVIDEGLSFDDIEFEECGNQMVEGLEDWINMIDFSEEGVKSDDWNHDLIDFSEEGMKLVDDDFEWLNQLVSFNNQALPTITSC